MECSIESALARLSGEAAWLAPLASRATDDGALLVRVGPSGLGGLAVEVRVELGECSRRGTGAFVPIRWQAARASSLFPVLDGDLEVMPLTPTLCRLALRGTYRTPLDGAGHLLDTAVLHRVAESTVRSFLRRVAESLAAG